MKQTLRAIFIVVGVAVLSLSAVNARGYNSFSAKPTLVSGAMVTDDPQGDQQSVGDIDDVVFYPNPVKDFMTVRFPKKGNFTVIIYNIIGDKVLTKSVLEDNEIHLDVSDLQNGLYFISYEYGGKVLTKRFSKIL